MYITIKEAVEDDRISFDEFYNTLREADDVGNWDDVNDTEIIYDYINDMMRKGIHVSHMLQALESNYCEHELWNIDLSNSMNTPEPIVTKLDLVDALYLWDEEDLNTKLNF